MFGKSGGDKIKETARIETIIGAETIIQGTLSSKGSIRVDAFTRLRSRALRLRGQRMLVVDRRGHVIHASTGLPFTFLQNVGRARRALAECLERQGVTVPGGAAPGGVA